MKLCIVVLSALLMLGCGEDQPTEPTASSDPSLAAETDLLELTIEETPSATTVAVADKGGSMLASVTVDSDGVLLTLATMEEVRYGLEGPLLGSPREVAVRIAVFVGSALASEGSKAKSFAQKDDPGCDLIPSRIPLFGGAVVIATVQLETPEVLRCCAVHDICYDAFGCTASSWFRLSGNDCTECNSKVVRCIASEPAPPDAFTCYDAECTTEPLPGPISLESGPGEFTCEGTTFGIASCECASPCEGNSCPALSDCCSTSTTAPTLLCGRLGFVDPALADRSLRRSCEAALPECQSGLPGGAGGAAGMGGFSGFGGAAGGGGMAGMGGEAGAGGLAGIGGEGGTSGNGGVSCQGLAVVATPNMGIRQSFTATTCGFDCNVVFTMTDPEGLTEIQGGCAPPGNCSSPTKQPTSCLPGDHVLTVRHSPSCDEEREATTTYTVVPPRFTISPESGPPGTIVTARGEDFRPGFFVFIRMDGQSVAGTSPQPDGTFEVTFEIPTDPNDPRSEVGPHDILAENIWCANETTVFTVTAAP